MSRPIALWRPHATLTSDDAGTTISKYTLPSTIYAPYRSVNTFTTAPRTLSYVPSLAYFCIQKLLEYPDQVHSLGPTRLVYQPPTSAEAYDILRALIPHYKAAEKVDLSLVDPRLWALVVQLYSDIPATFRTYTLPLSDEHLPLLQRIPCTPDFALLTTLELPGCSELTDDTVIELKVLHGLCAFDASGTALSAWGVERLSKTLTFAEEDDNLRALSFNTRKGPWGLRILRLRNCMNVKNDIFDRLRAFPLLSVVDLRGTCCTPQRTDPFRPSNETALYHPSNLTEALSRLSQLCSSDLFSHPQPFIIRIKDLRYPFPAPSVPTLNANRWTSSSDMLGERRDVFGLRHYPPMIHDADWQNYGEDGDSYDRESDYEDGTGAEGSSRTEDSDNDGSRDSEDPQIEAHEGDQVFWYMPIPNGTISEGRQEALPSVPPWHSANPFPGPSIPRDHRDTAAAYEAALLAERHSVMRFYSSVRRNPAAQIIPAVRPSVKPPQAVPQPSDPLMLYRSPPPWSSLPSSIAEWKTTSGSHQRKRARTKMVPADDELIRATALQNRARVKDGISTFRETVEKRRMSATAIHTMEQPQQGRSDQLISSNPFLRSSRAPKVRDTRSGRSGRSGDQGPVKQHSKPADTASTNTGRPLKPISQLKVPTLPSHILPKTNRRPSAKKSKSSDTQTTLTVRGPGIRSLEAKTTERPQIAPQPQKSREERKQGKAEKPRFDWNGWSRK